MASLGSAQAWFLFDSLTAMHTLQFEKDEEIGLLCLTEVTDDQKKKATGNFG